MSTTVISEYLYSYGRLKWYTVEIMTNVTIYFETSFGVSMLLKICQMFLKVRTSVIAVKFYNFQPSSVQCIVLSGHICNTVHIGQ